MPHSSTHTQKANKLRRVSPKSLVAALVDAGVDPERIAVESRPDGTVQAYVLTRQARSQMTDLEAWKANRGKTA